MFLIAFLSLKQAKNERELGLVYGKARLKPNYTKNPSLGELRSLWQINQVYKEEKQRRNLTFKNFATLCELPKKEFRKPCETESEFRNPLRNFRKPEGISQARRNFASLAKQMNFATPCKIFITLRNLPVIFRYFCTDFVRFLSQDILCNYLFSPCNQLKIF